MIRGFRDGNCNEEEKEEIHGFCNVCERNYNEEEEEEEKVIRDDIDIDEDKMMIFLCHPYKFKVVKEYDDIYIEIRSCLDGELKMTIDAKKIILKLSAPLENEEWEKLKKKKLGLISMFYIDIIDSVGEFTNSAVRKLKNETTKDMWEGRRLKRGIWNHYYVNCSRVFVPLILPRAAFKDEL